MLARRPAGIYSSRDSCAKKDCSPDYYTFPGVPKEGNRRHLSEKRHDPRIQRAVVGRAPPLKMRIGFGHHFQRFIVRITGL